MLRCFSFTGGRARQYGRRGGDNQQSLAVTRTVHSRVDAIHVAYHTCTVLHSVVDCTSTETPIFPSYGGERERECLTTGDNFYGGMGRKEGRGDTLRWAKNLHFFP